MIVIENIFDIGDEVYLKTDREQLKRIIFGFEIFKAGEILYKCICGTIVSVHYEFELTKEKDHAFS